MAQPSGMRSLERALDILEVLERAGDRLRLSDVAAECDLPVSTTQRILNSLITRGYVERSGNLYEVGLGVMPLAHAFLVHNPLSRAAQPVLEDLSNATGMAASLYVRSNDARVVLSRVMGPSSPRYIFPIGQRVPLVLGGGRVLIAWDDEADLRTLFENAGHIDDAQGEELSFEKLLAALARIREEGHYVARNERVLGIASAAAPIRDESGHPRAVILTSGLDSDFTDDKVVALTRLTKLAAGAVEDRLHRRRPGRP